MKIEVKAGTDAQTIAEIHRRLCVAHHAIMDIIKLPFPNNKTPLKTKSVDSILRLGTCIQSAWLSLENPFIEMAGKAAPLSCMNSHVDHWLRWLELS